MRIALVAVAAWFSIGCTKTPAYVYGRDLSQVQFHLFSKNMGVAPDTSVLDDPNNPFAFDPPTYRTGNPGDGAWAVEANGGPAAAFYSWATLDALGPSGEPQWYAANNLKKIFLQGLAQPDEQVGTRDRAIAAFQAVLDLFPNDLTFDSSGKIPSRLATWAYNGIVDLHGTVQGGWVLIGGEAVKP
jgi:hypothetical protein